MISLIYISQLYVSVGGRRYDIPFCRLRNHPSLLLSVASEVSDTEYIVVHLSGALPSLRRDEAYQLVCRYFPKLLAIISLYRVIYFNRALLPMRIMTYVLMGVVALGCMGVSGYFYRATSKISTEIETQQLTLQAHRKSLAKANSTLSGTAQLSSMMMAFHTLPIHITTCHITPTGFELEGSISIDDAPLLGEALNSSLGPLGLTGHSVFTGLEDGIATLVVRGSL